MTLREKLWPVFERHLFPAPSTDDLFNPYEPGDDPLGVPGAAAIRRDNLRAYLDAYTEVPPILVMAEAPGPWGCRFSGVPLTSEAQLADPDFWLDGLPTSLGDPHHEYSGRIYHRVVAPHYRRVFTWNAVPLHPHRVGEPLTIRTPRRREVQAFAPLVAGLVEALQPTVCVAVGRVAERAFADVGVASTYVRHPSQGGAKLFEAGMQRVFAQTQKPRKR